MKIVLFTFLSLSLLLFSDCKTVQYTPSDYPREQISFGTGGGFSGIVTEYFLLGNGDFFKMSSRNDTYQKGTRIDANRCEQIFANYRFLGIEDIEFNHPGNLYYFITHKSGEHEHQIVWGDSAHEVDENAKLFYKNLTNLVRQAGFAPERPVADK